MKTSYGGSGGGNGGGSTYAAANISSGSGGAGVPNCQPFLQNGNSYPSSGYGTNGFGGGIIGNFTAIIES